MWEEIRGIPYGGTLSYGTLAARAGNGRAVRAAGAATGRNPISIIVPCHRVVGSDGRLTGYAGGLERKRALLALESGRAAGSRRARQGRSGPDLRERLECRDVSGGRPPRTRADRPRRAAAARRRDGRPAYFFVDVPSTIVSQAPSLPTISHLNV